MASYTDKLTILFGGESKGLVNSVKSIIDNLDNVEDKMKALRVSMKKYGVEVDETGDATEMFAKNYDKLMDSMQTSTGSSLQQFEILRMSLNEIAQGVIQTTDTYLDEAGKLEQKIADINATTGGTISTEGLNKLKQEIRKASVEIGIDAALIGEKVTDALSAGADQSTVVDQVLLAGKVAKGTRGDIDSMVDLTNSMKNNYGEAAGSLIDMSDLIAKTYQQGDITGSEIGQGFGFVGGTAKAAGIDIKELFQGIAIASKTVNPAQVFSGMNAAITEMNRGGGKIDKLFKQIGEESLQTALKTNSFGEVMIKLNETGENLSGIFGAEASRAIIAIGSEADSARETMAAFNETVGTTERIFADASASLQFHTAQNEQYKKQWQETVGETMIPMQESFLKVQNEVLATMIDMNPAIKKVAGSFLFLTKGMAVTVTKGGDIARTFVSINEAQKAYKAMDIAGSVGKLNGKLSGASDLLRKMKINMSDATGKSANLKNVIGAVGLGAAISFTMPKLIQLSLAIKNYIGAVKSLEETTAKGLKQTMSLEEGSQAQLADKIVSIKRLIDLEKDEEGVLGKVARGYFTLGFLKNANTEETKIYEAALEATGEAIDKNTNLEELLGEVQEKYNAKKAENTIKNKDNIEAVAKAFEEAEIKKLTIAERVQARLKTLQSLGGKHSLTGDNTKDLEAINKQLEKIYAKKRAIAIKAIEAIKKDTESIGAETINIAREQELKKLEDTAEFYAKKQKFLADDNVKEIAEIEKQEKLIELKGDKRTDLDYEKANALYNLKTALLEQFFATQGVIDQKYIDWKDEKDQEESDKQDELNQERLDKAQEQAENLNDQLAIFGEAGASLLDETGEAQKEVFKKMIVQLLDYVQKQIEVMLLGSIAESFFTAGISAPKAIALAGVKATFGALKAGILGSFDEGGIPINPGLAMVHPTDIIVNPSTDNKMMNTLLDRIEERIGSNSQQNISLEVDGKVFGQVAMNAIKREQETMPVTRRTMV